MKHIQKKITDLLGQNLRSPRLSWSNPNLVDCRAPVDGLPGCAASAIAKGFEGGCIPVCGSENQKLFCGGHSVSGGFS